MKTTKTSHLGFSILISIFVICCINCKKEDVPSVTTIDVTSLGQTTAKCGGTITEEGGSSVLSRGVCWSTNSAPTINDAKTSDGAGAGSFSSTISGLSAGTKYFVRAYATNNKGTGYGMAMSFTTMSATIAVLSTNNVTNITQTTATCGGTITNDGAAPITSRGVCWSLNPNPTTSDSKTIDPNGNGSFNSNVTGLIGNTKYYVRAYATNSIGTSYGDQISFTTSPILPTISTKAVTSISYNNAVSGGELSSNGGTSIISMGICWSTSAKPTISDNVIINTSLPNFSCNLTGLVIHTNYYVRAFATNSVGIAYGNEVSFSTLGVPSLTVGHNTIAVNSATLIGTITNEGVSSVMSYGICWSTSPNPTISDNKMLSTESPSWFICKMTGLMANTKYYIRAFATNSTGTGYSAELQITTEKDFTGQTGTITDIDGNVYPTIGIGSQIWMTTNLRTTRYNNGDLIPTTNTSTLNIESETCPKYQWAYNGDEINVATYGRLYTAFVIDDDRNVCPVGWFVPRFEDWDKLINFIGGYDIGGGKLKEIGFTHWTSPNSGASNNYGFSALPGGMRNSSLGFSRIGISSFWWTSNFRQNSITYYYIGIDYDKTQIYSPTTIATNYSPMRYGYSIRCVRNGF